jgi:hypothetical protein
MCRTPARPLLGKTMEDVDGYINIECREELWIFCPS